MKIIFNKSKDHECQHITKGACDNCKHPMRVRYINEMLPDYADTAKYVKAEAKKKLNFTDVYLPFA